MRYDEASDVALIAAIHDITAARWHALPALYGAVALGIPCLAGSGCEGAGTGHPQPCEKPAGKPGTQPRHPH